MSNVSVDIELEKLDSNVDTKPDTNSDTGFFNLCQTIASLAFW